MEQLSVCLFKTISVSLNGEPLNSFRYDKVRGLLAYLAVESNQPHRRASLVGILWPDLPESAALTNLRQALANLRVVLNDHGAVPPTLTITRNTIGWNLNAGCNVDVIAFNRLLDTVSKHNHRSLAVCKGCIQNLEEAIHLYRGDFLADFFIPDSSAFEEWAAVRREIYQQRVIKALSQLTDLFEQREEYERAMTYAYRQLEIDPWREEVHRRLMHLLSAVGQRSAAIAQYENCRETLASEFGLEPEEETQRLYEKISSSSSEVRSDEGSDKKQISNTLPHQTTPFIGREKELNEVHALMNLPECRLVTITGPGGMGKTRLAVEIAAEAQGSFKDGILFIPLAETSLPGLLFTAIAHQLGFQPGSEDYQEEFLAFLSEKQLLLIFDNFEQCLEETREVSEILARCPEVLILTTSRERLRLQGEWVYELKGLVLPEENLSNEFDDVESVKLFVNGARRSAGGFPIREEDKSAIVKICRLLDGMPLALELAAAWVRNLGIQEIADEIEKDISFLSGTLRDLPQRQQSLQSVFDHSWRKLDSEEQGVFRKMGVFRGSFSRSSAENVAQASLLAIGSLLDKSLIVRTTTGRYELHEISRQYALQQLKASREEEHTCRKHLEHYLELAETGALELEGNEAALWFQRLDLEMGNLRAALRRSLGNGELEFSLRLVAALYRFWYWRSMFSEGTYWFDAVLEAVDKQPKLLPGDLVAKALHYAGVLHNERGHLDQASRCYLRSLELRKKVGDLPGQAACLNSLGAIAFDRKDYKAAENLFSESLVLRRKVGENESLFIPLTNLGILAKVQGDLKKARSLFEESIELLRNKNNPGHLSQSLGDLASVVLAQGDHQLAKSLFYESLELCQEIGNLDGICYGLEGMASVLSSQGSTDRDYIDASRLFGAAEALRESIGSPLSPPELEDNLPYITRLKEILGKEAYINAWLEGHNFTQAQSIKVVLDELLPSS
jgi:predicted ATPase/DNA-binding SARP family transcriptional activator